MKKVIVMADIEKVIKEFELYVKEFKPCCTTDGVELDMLKAVLELLKEQPRWIPVTERLPKSMVNKVIVYLQHDDLVPQIGYGHYEKFQGEEMWYNLETDEQFTKRGYTVTHWMPMPKSPEGEKLALS
jgi:hypothetical protein